METIGKMREMKMGATEKKMERWMRKNRRGAHSLPSSPILCCIHH